MSLNAQPKIAHKVSIPVIVTKKKLKFSKSTTVFEIKLKQTGWRNLCSDDVTEPNALNLADWK